MQSNPSRIFVCYAQKDNKNSDPSKKWLDRLLEQLQSLELQEQVSVWSDQKIEVGDNWNDKIQNTLQEVKAAILLVSPTFLGSKYIRNSEVPVLLKDAQERGVKILTIILRPCLFNETKFKYQHPQNGLVELSLSTFQAANSPSQPLNSLTEHEQDKIFLSVAQQILKIVKAEEKATKS